MLSRFQFSSSISDILMICSSSCQISFIAKTNWKVSANEISKKSFFILLK